MRPSYPTDPAKFREAVIEDLRQLQQFVAKFDLTTSSKAARLTLPSLQVGRFGDTSGFSALWPTQPTLTLVGGLASETFPLVLPTSFRSKPDFFLWSLDGHTISYDSVNSNSAIAYITITPVSGLTVAGTLSPNLLFGLREET